MPLKAPRARVRPKKAPRAVRARKTPQERLARAQQAHAEEREDSNRTWDRVERIVTKGIEVFSADGAVPSILGGIGGMAAMYPVSVELSKANFYDIPTRDPFVERYQVYFKVRWLGDSLLPNVKIGLPALPGSAAGSVAFNVKEWFALEMGPFLLTINEHDRWPGETTGHLIERVGVPWWEGHIKPLWLAATFGMAAGSVYVLPKVARSAAAALAGVIPG